MNLARTKKIVAAALAVLMILSFMPMMQENAFAAKKAKKPAKVKSVKVTVAKNNKVTVTWKKAKNAKQYNVSIKDGSSKLTSVKTSKKLKVTFQGGSAVNYTIKVQGVNGKKKGAFSKAVSKKTNEVVSAAVQKALDEAKEAQAKAEEAKKAAEAALKEAEEAKTAAEQRAIAAETELEQLKKEKADKEAADAVVEAWADVPEITVDSDEDDIAEVQAVIVAYDELTDDQKALVPDDVKAEIEAAKAVIAQIEELNKKKAAVITAIKAATPANYPTETNTVTIDGEEYCVMAIDNEANEAKLVKKMPVFDSDGHGIPFDKNGGYNWNDSSLRSFVNDKENGFFKGRDLLYSMSVEKENKYSITKVAWVEDEDDPILTPYNYTTNDRAMLMDFDSFNPCRRDWSAAWNDNSISTWLYRTVPNEDLDEGIVLVEDDDETQDLTYAWFQDYTYYNGVSYNAEPTFNGLSRKVGICPVVYVSIA